MTHENLAEIHEVRPFNPFTLHLSDGRMFDVVTPEFLFIHPSHTMALVVHTTGNRHSWIAINKINHIDFIDSPLPAAATS